MAQLTPPWPTIEEAFAAIKVVVEKVRGKTIDRELAQAVSIALYAGLGQIPLKESTDPLILRGDSKLWMETPDDLEQLAGQLESSLPKGGPTAQALPIPWTTVLAILLKILDLVT